MRIARVVATVSWLLVVALQCGAQELSRYKLGPGDTISIRVLGEEELRRERVRLSDAGTISFPVLGELRVRGLTVGAVEEQVASGLRGRYLLNPQVNVTIDEYRPFFVNGMIERPGSYSFAPGMTVRKAISVAGGFKERAARDKISIIRDDDAKQIARRVDLNTAVLPGDIITVEESFF